MGQAGHYHYGTISVIANHNTVKGKRAVQFLRTSVFDELAGFCVVKTTKSEGSPTSWAPESCWPSYSRQNSSKATS